MTNSSNKNSKKDGFFDTVRKDFQELKESFLDDNQKKRLEKMNLFKRGFYIFGWLLKILFLKLTRVRRLLLIFGIILIISGNSESGDNNNILGILFILFILMLELKDKLLAKDELQAGRAVQDALLPQKNPAIPGWDIWLYTRPANDVGGDLVDFIKISETRFGLSLGDVAGKGLPAALFMAKLQASLRALAPDYKSLSKFCLKINQIFCRDGLPDKFASLVYLELESNKNEVKLVNAGHLPPVIFKDKKTKEMPKGGPALGLTKNANYPEHKTDLQKGELLIVYSDGLTEARNKQGDFWGDQKLLDLLPEINQLKAEEIGERLLKEVDLFTGDAKIHDDLSLIILKRSD